MAAAALVALVAGCTPISSPHAVMSTPTPAWTPPAGFFEYSPGVAWRWLKGDEQQCGDDRCIQVELVTKDGCPQLLYAKASITDSQGRNVGYTNDTTSGVNPGQKAVLTMPDTTGGLDGIQSTLTEVSCL